MALLSEYGIRIGKLDSGERNLITDVMGVRVGHETVVSDGINTGVTVILPTEGNIFLNKLIAGSYILNGFGKTAGLVQMDELGTLETPIALTNTMNVGIVHDAMVEMMIETCARDGHDLKSVNPVIGETNDSMLNDIKQRAVTKNHVKCAVKSASQEFLQGDVGAGKGTVCFGFKGGIGSASRVVDGYTVGILVQSNFGKKENLILNGFPFGEHLAGATHYGEQDKGSIMVVLATDAPVSDRQIRRILKRASVGLIRTGSYIGHGSGDVFIGFSVAQTVSHSILTEKMETFHFLQDSALDHIFQAAAEATEEAIFNSMLSAGDVMGFNGVRVPSLRPCFEKLIYSEKWDWSMK